MEKGKNSYNDKKITEEAENLISKKVGLDGNINKYLTRVKIFIVNKRFHEYCSKKGISSKEKKQKFIDDMVSHYISNCIFSEKLSDIICLITMLGANVNRKNERTNLSIYECIENSKEIRQYDKAMILTSLDSFNLVLENNREMIEKPADFYNQDVDLYIESLLEEEEKQQNMNYDGCQIC